MPKQPSGVLVPAYEYPEPPRWNVLTDVARTMMLGGLLVVANDNSGHFKKADEKYTKAIEALQGACSPVLGYVHDCYDNTGTGALCPRTTDIMDDVDRWFTIYGVDGIFIDQLLRERVEHAERLVQDVLNRRRDAIVVLNPGNIPEEDFMARTHPAIVVIQEDRFADYEGWPPAGWVTNRATEATTSIDANRLAIIAHTLPDPPNTEHVDQFIAKAAQYKIGWIYAQQTTTSGSEYEPLSIHLQLLAERLGRCSRLGCTTPFTRFFCQMANFLVCYILRANRRLRDRLGGTRRRSRGSSTGS
jgi:hypothetical protein